MRLIAKGRVGRVLDQQLRAAGMQYYACKDSEQRLPGVRNAVHSPPPPPPPSGGQKTCFVLPVLCPDTTPSHGPLVFTLFSHFIGIQLKILVLSLPRLNSIDWKTLFVPFVVCFALFQSINIENQFLKRP